jgi:hypothetical protein
MTRREFITLLGGAVVARPCSGLAQSPAKRPLIGFLGASSKAAGERFYGGFPVGMRELGYLEGRDYGVEGRYADGDASRLPLLSSCRTFMACYPFGSGQGSAQPDSEDFRSGPRTFRPLDGRLNLRQA